MNIFIACSKSKNNYRCLAREMYTPSPIFRKRMEFTKHYPNANIYILSAKYGLLKLDDIIDTYDMNLGHQNKSYKKEWLDKVLLRIDEFHINKNDKTYFATGSEYCKLLLPYFKNSITEKEIVKKVTNGGGIGYALQYYDIVNGRV